MFMFYWNVVRGDHGEIRTVSDTEIEKNLKNITNAVSLVLRTCTGLFFFTGDVDKRILNGFLQLNDKNYFMVEAPHHGSYYGKGLKNLTTDILVISRGRRNKIAKEYFYEINWSLLIDTLRFGTCIIDTSRGIKVVYLKYTTKNFNCYQKTKTLYSFIS